jgi:hypothetical protein
LSQCFVVPGAVVLYFSQRANAAQDQEIQMSYARSHSFSIGGFAIACSIALACFLTIAINGSMLLGFNHLAQSHDSVTTHTASRLAGAAVLATQEVM